MVRIAKQTDPVKLEELKSKINDQGYLQILHKTSAACSSVSSRFAKQNLNTL